MIIDCCSCILYRSDNKSTKHEFMLWGWVMYTHSGRQERQCLGHDLYEENRLGLHVTRARSAFFNRDAIFSHFWSRAAVGAIEGSIIRF